MNKPTFFLILFLLVFSLQSCKKKENETINENSIQKESELKKDSTTFKSVLRPNEKIELGKVYTDTVKFVRFDDNGDDSYFFVKKNKDTISLIYNTDDPKIIRGTDLEIQWKMDSLRPVGDPEYLDFTEYLISWKKIKSKSSERDFSKLKNQGFVLSCGTGCAMTYNVKEIRSINEVSIKVTFEVDMYVDGELTETFDETYLFNYGNKNTIKNMKTNENIENIFTESAQRSFKEFGTKLME